MTKVDSLNECRAGPDPTEENSRVIYPTLKFKCF